MVVIREHVEACPWPQRTGRRKYSTCVDRYVLKKTIAKLRFKLIRFSRSKVQLHMQCSVKMLIKLTRKEQTFVSSVKVKYTFF